ncbi:hypothetical protein DERP_000224 [Dermatophagoides pteronyssinus]|uniref:Uncharacterized protein n=1 Tax=Dermatophagoides pteronyssinus TaxID=6956 RepID=A0ABQ8IZI6_DERPT|nr:hypothetical protein DERP_000224 [Dermatophagoides pteronyssinus]
MNQNSEKKQIKIKKNSKNVKLSITKKSSMVNNSPSIDSMRKKVQLYLKEINKKIPYQGFLIYRNPSSQSLIETPLTQQKLESNKKRPNTIQQPLSLGETLGSKVFTLPTTLQSGQLIMQDSEIKIITNNIPIDNNNKNNLQKIRNNLKNCNHIPIKHSERSSSSSESNDNETAKSSE